MDDEASIFSDVDSKLYDVDSVSDDEAPVFSDVDPKLYDVDSDWNDEASRFSDVDPLLFNVASKCDDEDSVFYDEASNNCFKDSNFHPSKLPKSSSRKKFPGLIKDLGI